MNELKQHGIDVELDATVAEGHYSNLAIISHSPTEFETPLGRIELQPPQPAVGFKNHGEA